MRSFPLDMIVFVVELGVSELGLEGATLRLATAQWWGCFISGDTLVG